MRGKKFLNIILSSLVCASLIITPVHAEPEEQQANTTETAVEEKNDEPDEYGHYSVEYTHDIVPETNKLPNWPQGPLVNAESAILMDMDTGEILYGKNPHKQQYPASITKLLTVLVALDYVQQDDTIEFSQESIDFIKPGDAHIGMTPGEIISIKDALYAVLFASANEVSYALAENVGNKYLNGGFDEFIQKMNEKSKEIGCLNSNWVNANGLHDDQHYTTAYDMALIGSEIYKQPLFNEMMENFQYTIPATNLVDEERVFQQHHKMTWENGKYYYENCKGGKTGYTDRAQTTLVTLADNGERKFVAVLLYDRGGTVYDETRALFDYGYTRFEKVYPSDVNSDDSIKTFSNIEDGMSLPKGISFEELDSNITADEENFGKATVTYMYNDNPMGTYDVELTDEAYNELTGVVVENPEEENTEHKKDEPDSSLIIAMKISFIVVISLIGLVLIVFLVKLYKYKKRKKLRAKRNKKRKANKNTKRNKRR